MRVVVAEKPSVARDLARVLGATQRRDGFFEGFVGAHPDGAGLRITWCHGHMAELEEPAHYDAAWKRWSLDALPIAPARFVIRARKGASDQLAVLERLLRDPSTVDVVNACDAGREGELIFRWVMELCGCTRPVLRLWTSSLTDGAIRQAWGALARGTAYDRLGDAARCRAEADWLVGLNATRALTCRARDAGPGDLLTVGRVQTPTLAMIVGRDRAIDAFVPVTYHGVKATFEAERGTFVARWFRPDLAADERATGPGGPGTAGAADEPDGEAPNAERLDDRVVAERIADRVRNQRGVIETAERKRTRERPPLLYDLTSLQRRANQRYGLGAQRTLDVAQALYETHKLLTYPRTDSRYLTPDQVPLLPDILRGLQPIPPYAPFVARLLAAPIQPGPRVVNAAEVGDHPAILPTGRTPPPDLPSDEKRVFDLVARRLIAALMPDALFDATKLVVAVDVEVPEDLAVAGRPVRFRASGRVCADPGWRAVDPPGKSVELELPPVEVGDPATAVDVEVTDGQTRPPRHYTDGTVLRAMETAGRALDDEALARALRGAGLGTPATRAAILQTLIERAYVARVGKELHATDKGKALIDAVPIDALKSAELTAAWEGRLSQMADGRGAPRDAFMGDVVEHVRAIVGALIAAPAPVLAATDAADELGACPKCAKPVRARGPVYACDGGRGCGFVVFATMAKRKISPRAVKQLLTHGRTPVMKGFKSKAGKPFDAAIAWDGEQGRVTFRFDDAPSPAADPGTRSRKRPVGAPPSAMPAGVPAEAPAATHEDEALRGGAPPRAPRAIGAGDPCPSCGDGTIITGRTALGCSRWREGCGYRAALPSAGPHAEPQPSGIPSASPGRPGERGT